MKNALTITMYGKDYIPENYNDGIYNDYNNFKYAFHNKANKEIKAIGILFIVFNALGEQIGKSFSMDFINDRIYANGTYKKVMLHFQSINLIMIIVKLSDANFEDLTFKFNISKIVFTDDTTLE